MCVPEIGSRQVRRHWAQGFGRSLEMEWTDVAAVGMEVALLMMLHFWPQRQAGRQAGGWPGRGHPVL